MESLARLLLILPLVSSSPALAAVDGSTDGVGLQLMSHLSYGQLDGSGSGSDCWGYTSPSGREYALIGSFEGTIVVEITDPSTPVIVASIPGKPSGWRDIKTYQTYAYVVAENSEAGIQVIDLSQVDAGIATHLKFAKTGSSHNVVVDETSGFLYRVSTSVGDIMMYDLATAKSPALVGQWNLSHPHDSQAVTYTSGPFAGQQILFNCASWGTGFGLEILDVTDKSNPVVRAQVPYAGEFSHQGWLSEDRKYFYLNDEADEPSSYPTTTTHVFEVSDLDNPSYVGNFTNGQTSNDHNCFVRGDLLFAANYTTGLRVFDLGVDPLSPPEIAYYDTYPANDSPGFTGLWGCFPFFPSGTVIGSDTVGGLFVWRLGDPLVAFELPGGVPDWIPEVGEAVPVTVTEASPGDLLPGSAMLIYDVGAGEVQVPLVDLGGGSFEAPLPGQACGTLISWRLEAKSSDGVTWRCPSLEEPRFQSRVRTSEITLAFDDLELPPGWTLGVAGDDATTGIWEWGDPIGTGAQPEDDHTPAGSLCFFTGQGSAGGSIGENDVDGGTTTLLSPTWNLAGSPDARIAYWRWYSNGAGGAPNTDVLLVQMSVDAGTTWLPVEEVGPAGPEVDGGWIRHEFRVADVAAPTAQVQLRFLASDLGSGSIVEAAVDDVEILLGSCEALVGTSYCGPATANSSGVPAVLDALGSDLVADDSLLLVARDMPPKQFGYFLASLTQGSVVPPGSQGTLCLGGQILRFSKSAASSGTFGTFHLQVDLTQLPPPHSAPVLPGETWNWQAWFRDKVGGQTTSNFTDGLTITFQ